MEGPFLGQSCNHRIPFTASVFCICIFGFLNLCLDEDTVSMPILQSSPSFFSVVRSSNSSKTSPLPVFFFKLSCAFASLAMFCSIFISSILDQIQLLGPGCQNCLNVTWNPFNWPLIQTLFPATGHSQDRTCFFFVSQTKWLQFTLSQCSFIIMNLFHGYFCLLDFSISNTARARATLPVAPKLGAVPPENWAQRQVSPKLGASGEICARTVLVTLASWGLTRAGSEPILESNRDLRCRRTSPV